MSSLVMALSCLGSLNALQQTGDRSFWRKHLKKKMPSDDTMGRVLGRVRPDELRIIAKRLYTKLKRNKALLPFYGNYFALIIDGHESMASYLRCCSDCLQRRIQTKEGERIQYYHRHVMAMLWCGNMCLPLDVEPQRPGEDEGAAALRLLERLLQNYPRAFDVILGDGLYLRQDFFKASLAHNKHLLVVLKDEQRDLLQDARLLFPLEGSTLHQTGNTQRQCWDIEGFQPWFQTEQEMAFRVVRSLEQTTVRRQKDGKQETLTSEWIWTSTISQKLMATLPFVECGHGRWNIENRGFNELVNQWHFNHTYKHDLTAMTNFWLMTMIAYILFHAFFLLNLKPQARTNRSKAYFIATMLADLLASESKVPP